MRRWCILSHLASFSLFLTFDLVLGSGVAPFLDSAVVVVVFEEEVVPELICSVILEGFLVTDIVFVGLLSPLLRSLKDFLTYQAKPMR